jgi:hypothetical protein
MLYNRLQQRPQVRSAVVLWTPGPQDLSRTHPAPRPKTGAGSQNTRKCKKPSAARLLKSIFVSPLCGEPPAPPRPQQPAAEARGGLLPRPLELEPAAALDGARLPLPCGRDFATCACIPTHARGLGPMTAATPPPAPPFFLRPPPHVSGRGPALLPVARTREAREDDASSCC